MNHRLAGLVPILLLVLCALTIGLRRVGIDFRLPRTHLDGSVIVAQVKALRSQKTEGSRFKFYPLLLARATAWLPSPDPLASSGKDRTAKQPTPPGEQEALSLDEHLQRANAPWREVRIVSLFLSILLIPATFYLLRLWLSVPWSLFAAALIATSLLHHHYSTQVRPHGTAVSSIFLALLAAIHLRRSGSIWAYALGGITAGMSVGSLHYGVFAWPPFLMALFLRSPRAKARGRKTLVLGFLLALGITAAFIYWCYPFHFGAEGQGFLRLQTKERGLALNLSGQPLFLGIFNGEGFEVIPETLWSFDPVLLIGSLAGMGLLVCRRFLRYASSAGTLALNAERRRDGLVVAAHCVPYVLVIGLYGNTWERFIVQLLPYCAGLTAFALAWVYSRTQPLGMGLGILALVIPGLLCGRLAQVRSEPSTYHKAADWIADNLEPDGERVMLFTYDDVPLLHSRDALRQNRKRRWSSMWLRYQLRTPAHFRTGPAFDVLLPPGSPGEHAKRIDQDPIAYARAEGAQYVLIDVVPEYLGWRELENARDHLRRDAELVWSECPLRNQEGVPATLPHMHTFDWDPIQPFVRRVWESESEGPSLELYRIP